MFRRSARNISWKIWSCSLPIMTACVVSGGAVANAASKETQAKKHVAAQLQHHTALSSGNVRVAPVPSVVHAAPVQMASKRASVPVKTVDSEIEQIQVHAQRQASGAAALDEQRHSVGVSTVMSRQQIEQAPQTNLSDILTRMPGISAYSNMSGGQAATGETQYMSIRGLDSSYNAYTLNGERVAASDPATRAVSFDMLAPYGITSVKVSKSTSADMDGDAIGGAIDIRTPTAFDFTGSLNRISLQGQINDYASRIGVPFGGGTGQVELARRFGHDGRFGVYMTGYYSDKSVAASAVAPNKSLKATALGENGLPLTQVSAVSTSQMKYDIYTSRLRRYGGSLSLNYQGDHQDFYALGTYGAYNTKQEDNQVSLRGNTGLYGADGQYQSPTATRGQYFETNDSNQLMTTQKIGGETRLDRWTIDYDLFNSYSVLASPDQVEGSMYGPFYAQGPFKFNVSNTTLPRVSGPATGVSQLLNQDIDKFYKTQGRDAQSIADMYGVHADANYRFKSDILKSIAFGVKVSETDRQSYAHPFFHSDNNFVYNGPFFGGPKYTSSNPGGPIISNIPGQQVDVFGGAAGPLRLLSRDWVRATTVPYKYQNDPKGAGIYTKNDWNANTSTGTERIYAGYVALNLQAGPVDIHPGFRYEWTDFGGTHWQNNGNGTGNVARMHQSYGTPLPYLNINWRPTSMSVLRFGVRRAFTRPAFGLVNGATTISLDSQTNAIQSVSMPNPNLRPTSATVFDFSGELYNHHEGVVSAAVYYKRIQKYVFMSVSGTSNSSSLGGVVPTGSYTDGNTQFSMPNNGGNATLEGLELNAQQRLTFLPGWLSGFGVNGNITLQHSNAQSGLKGHPDTALPRAPEMMYNLGVFYNRGPAKFNLNYNYVGTQLLGLNSSLPDYYLQPTQRLDMSAQYALGYGMAATVAMQNLLNTPAFWETAGKGKSFMAYDGSANGSFVQTGRMYLFGLNGSF